MSFFNLGFLSEKTFPRLGKMYMQITYEGYQINSDNGHMSKKCLIKKIITLLCVRKMQCV